MTRLLRPPELGRLREQDNFDPIVEGERHGLSRELSLAIWKRASADATDRAGRRDEEQAQQQFHKLATRIAARGGWLPPDPGRVTRVGVEITGDSLPASSIHELRPRTPGRETLVAVEARRWRKLGEALAVTSEDAKGGTEKRELPGASEVMQALAALQQPAQPEQTKPLPADRATLMREVARLYRDGELAEALRHGQPGIAGAAHRRRWRLDDHRHETRGRAVEQRHHQHQEH